MPVCHEAVDATIMSDDESDRRSIEGVKACEPESSVFGRQAVESGVRRLDSLLDQLSGRSTLLDPEMLRVELADIRHSLLSDDATLSDRRLAEESACRAREAQARAARSSALGILASSLLHELTQPLGAVAFLNGSALDLLERPRPSLEELNDLMQSIDTEIGRAADILGRLRDFLRTRTLIKEVVRLDELIRQAVQLMRWRAEDCRVRLCIHDAPIEGPEVVIDRLQIEQVLVNLIENAIQAIERSGSERREVGIGLEVGPEVVELWVSDTGPGLPFAEHEPLFDLFHSLRDAGLGVGLAVSRSLVEAHGGRLWVDADPQEGALFRFTLPLIDTGSGDRVGKGPRASARRKPRGRDGR